jgi:hypothetical protein
VQSAIDIFSSTVRLESRPVSGAVAIVSSISYTRFGYKIEGLV